MLKPIYIPPRPSNAARLIAALWDAWPLILAQLMAAFAFYLALIATP